MKVTNISPPETIVDTIGQSFCITNALTFDNTSSIRISFTMIWQKYSKQPNVQHYLLKELQLQFLKILKGALYGLGQFLVTEIPLKMLKNNFYFTLKAVFVLKIFKLFSSLLWSCIKTA